ncbi:hypothetical protein GOP47_0012564 [Adiantum capillus-veneris]|uniref:Calcium uniporter protein C-terminal domain-containing protein n=1 Tax=Adiantum capillus-veneris TaxID=13818 RepID=A0A9D4ZEF3_ADICA|nr:hypothetical protein GOP47_0012564 [Adiantum capillus-veneris]
MGRNRALGRLICATKSTLCANPYHYSGLSASVSASRVYDINPGPLPWHTHFHADAVMYMQKRHTGTYSSGPTKGIHDSGRANLSVEERQRMLKLVDLEDLKKRLRSTGQDCMPYVDALKLLQEIGIGATNAEADAMLQRLDSTGVILILRNMVFVRPDKVAELIASALPLSLAGDNDPRREELWKLEKEKEEIDKAAQKQVRRMLWTGFGVLSLQSLIFFRLTFWDLSWDVMEPITFFVTSSAVLAGLLFFIFTRREPSYQDLTHMLFSIKQEKLMKKNKFDAERLKQLQIMHCCLPPPHDHH